MITKIAIAVAALAAVFLVAVLSLASMQPDTFRIERSTVIDAPPEAILAQLTDFRRWTEWSPWEKLDPNLKRTYGGAENGVGATYAWDGNSDAGQGRMEITEADPNHLAIDLQFIKPFEARNVAEFTLGPRGDSTKVTWSMSGPNLFVGKVMALFIDMDTMIGKDFEAGLADLKRLAERPATAQRAAMERR